MISKLKSTTGVTMVELIIVAVIVSIVASMAVPRFQEAYDRLQFRSANRDMVSTLRLARSMAIAEKLQYGVSIDFQDRTMTLFQDITNPGLFSFDVGDKLVRVDTLDRQVEYIFSDVLHNTITFSSNGSADFTGGGNLILMKFTENSYLEGYHNIVRSTGRVASYESYEEWALEHNESYDN